MIRHAAAAALAFTLAGTAVAGPVPLSVGKWTVTQSFEYLGKTETDTFAECLLPEESNLDLTVLVSAMAGGENCTASDVVHTSGQATLRLSCSVEDGMSGGSFAVSHTPETFNITGAIEFTSPNWESTVPANMTITGARIGACPAK